MAEQAEKAAKEEEQRLAFSRWCEKGERVSVRDQTQIFTYPSINILHACQTRTGSIPAECQRTVSTIRVHAYRGK